MMAVIEHLRKVGGKKFSMNVLEVGRQIYDGLSFGTWSPKSILFEREVIVIGSGPSIRSYQKAIEGYIRDQSPYVVALNTQKSIKEDLIDLRAACHPVRLLADCEAYRGLKQPLATPYDRLDEDIRLSLEGVKIMDYGLTVNPNEFIFGDSAAVVPIPLVIAYVLAFCASGKAKRVLLAGFDGYDVGDARNSEMNELLAKYVSAEGAVPIVSITPTRYQIPTTSLYAN
jgi:4-hydroxy 2-oxovalerate aldolase